MEKSIGTEHLSKASIRSENINEHGNNKIAKSQEAQEENENEVIFDFIKKNNETQNFSLLPKTKNSRFA